MIKSENNLFSAQTSYRVRARQTDTQTDRQIDRDIKRERDNQKNKIIKSFFSAQTRS